MAQLNPMLVELQNKILNYNKDVENKINDVVGAEQRIFCIHQL